MNNRQSFRLRKQFEIAWSIPDQKIDGKGTIFNISLTGMLFETDKLFDPEHGLTMFFNAPQAPAFPSKGKLAWFKKAGQGAEHYQCGVRFPSEIVHSQPWARWMEENIFKLADAQDSKILDRYLNAG